MCVRETYLHGDNCMLPPALLRECAFPIKIIGVDMNPGTICEATEKYKHDEHCDFLNVCISDEDADAISHNSWSLKTDEIHPAYTENRSPATTPSMTLQSLFDKIIVDHPDSKIYGLHLDIEGSELDVLKCYDFSIKPEYICIECHTDLITLYGMHDIIKMLYAEGYYLYEKSGEYKDWLKFTLIPYER